MTLVRFNNKPFNRSFNNFMDDFFTGNPSLYKNEQFTRVPVNIREREESYVLELFAPGWNKEDFSIQLDKNLLTIKANKKEEAETSNEKVVLKEFKSNPFTRSFTIDEQINGDQIVAEYINGVLTLNLPKKAPVKASTKEITVH